MPESCSRRTTHDVKGMIPAKANNPIPTPIIAARVMFVIVANTKRNASKPSKIKKPINEKKSSERVERPLKLDAFLKNRLKAPCKFTWQGLLRFALFLGFTGG